LTLALLALDVGAGHEVITSACSFFATAEAISHVGATPVFCDIDPMTANIDPGCLEGKITSRTKAIIPVHLYGQPAKMQPILDTARAHGLHVIEDCAQAVGAQYNEKRVGTLGNAGCFSFYPSKNLGAIGDAGALVTDDEAIALRCRMLSNHGGTRKYEHMIVGYNSRLDAIQAAILSLKLPYLDKWNRQRQQIAESYKQRFSHSDVECLQQQEGMKSVNHLYPVRVQQRDYVLSALQHQRIGAEIHYPQPLPLCPAYQSLDYTAEQFPHAVMHASTVLSLPIFPLMKQAESDRVADTLIDVLNNL
jgi:dTDP-4-amino-4,6-dideoxygalactose transaminase